MQVVTLLRAIAIALTGLAVSAAMPGKALLLPVLPARQRLLGEQSS